MKNFRISYLVLILLCNIISSCNAQSTNIDALVGKWKEVNAEGEILQLMTIKRDSTIEIFPKDLGMNISFKLESLDGEKLSMVRAEERGIEETSKNENQRMFSPLSKKSEEKDYIKYVIDSNLLIFTSLYDTTRFLKCINKICDYEQEYFIKKGVSVHALSLPSSSRSNLFELTGNEVSIYFGQPRKSYEAIYGYEARLSNGKNFITFDEIPLMIEKERIRIEKEAYEGIDILLHVDSDIKAFEVRELLMNIRLDRLGIETINCAVLVNDETTNSVGEVMKTSKLMELLEDTQVRVDSSVSIQKWIIENE